MRTPIALHCGSFIFNMVVKAAESGRNRQILTGHSIKFRPFLFPFTIDKCDLIYSECVKVFFIGNCRVFYGSQGQTQSLFFSM